MKYSYQKTEYPFESGSLDSFRIKDFILVSDWIEKHFRLSTAYAVQGRIKLFPWQIEIVNAIQEYDVVIEIAPVQTGKSMLAEGVAGYTIDNDTCNMMFIYAKKETVMDVFDERIKPMVEEIPAIRKYWSGYDDDLTKRRIKLRHLIIRIASSGLKTDIASHNAGFVYGSELAKWPKKDFSQTKAVEGRKQASRMLGKKVKTFYETSPEHDQDPSYIETHKPGTLFLKPHFKCPECGNWQVLTDRNIKEIPDKKGVKDHNPERIRQNDAAQYECLKCQCNITESDRLKMSFHVVWAAQNEIITPEGKVLKRKKANRVVFNWNRLVDTTWSFCECLACYFEALNSPNPEDLKTYRNEDMAEWVKLRALRYEDSFLRSKCKPKYYQFGADAYVPDGVTILTMAVDTQDNGFFYVVRGYGQNLESWLVRSDFIHCDMKEFSNPADVLARVNQEIYRYPYQKRNGKTIPILFSLWDRGGHRSKDVDYIASHTPNAGAYIGATSRTAPLIEQKKSGHYFGMTENLSRIVQKNIESDIWHLPIDISNAYCTQVLNQYDEEYTDTRGNKKKKWICKDPDHFRDCENYLAGIVILLDLQSRLFDDTDVQEIEKAIDSSFSEGEKGEKTEKNPENDEKSNIMGNYSQELLNHGW